MPASTPGRRLALCLLALSLLLAACSERDDRPRLLFVGLDGATWKVIGPMIEQGELPAFRHLIAEGAYMPDFETISTTHSPLVWTSVATGRRPREHGILDYVEMLPGGEEIPITSNARRVPAIWEIASRHGLTVGVIGWWATWPAEEVAGYVISDHANPTSLAFEAVDRQRRTAGADDGRRMQRDVFPPELASLLAPHWLDRDRFPIEELRQRSRLTDEQLGLVLQAPWLDQTKYSVLKLYYAVDLPHFQIAMRLLAERPTDLTLLYLRSPDPIQHYAWDLVEIDRYDRQTQTHLGLTPHEHVRRDVGIVEGVYRYLDSFLAEIMAAMAPGTTLIVASDHGAEPTPFPDDTRPGAHTTAAKGVLFIHGPQVKAGTRLTRGDPLDLFPTMAWLLGLPLADELAGEPLVEAFEDDFVRLHQPRRVPSYGPRETAPGLPSVADDAMIEQLRMLGYVEREEPGDKRAGDDRDDGEHAGGDRTDRQGSDPERANGERDGDEHQITELDADDYLELSLTLYRAGRYQDAIEACRKALRLRPDDALAYNNMCSCYNWLGEWDSAIEACERAIELAPDLDLVRANLRWALDGKSKQ